MTQIQHISALTKRIPVNALGLLEGIYRPDLLPERPNSITPSNNALTIIDVPQSPNIDEASAGLDKTLTSQAVSVSNQDAPNQVLNVLPPSQSMTAYERELRAAYVPLVYEEGYPTLDGRPFWVQLSFEPADAYMCFQLYLRQGAKGMRQLHMLLEDEQIRKMGITYDLIESCFHMYYWTARAKSFDIFDLAFKRRQREIRAMTIDDEHFIMGERLMDMCRMYLDENGEELMETLTPKAFIELLKAATQLQRVSVGLPASGPAAGSTGLQGGSMEIALKTVAQQLNSGSGGQDAVQEAKSGAQQKQNMILNSPEAFALAQQLIITINPTNKANNGQ